MRNLVRLSAHIGHRVAIKLDLWVRALGRFAAELARRQLGDPKVVEAIKQMTTLHRNPLIHPEAIFSAEEAIGIIGMARCGPDVRIASLRLQRRNGIVGRDQLARRANHQKSVQPFTQKYSSRAVGQINDLTPRVSPVTRGGSRSSRTRGEMRWTRNARDVRA